MGNKRIAADLNVLSGYLALDDFEGEMPSRDALRPVDVIAHAGNQVVATLFRACTLAQRAPHAVLLFSGGVGHSTRPLYENLRANNSITTLCGFPHRVSEAEMCSVIAKRGFGIPDHRILVEKRSTNAGENAWFSMRALLDGGVKHETILLLHDPTMQRRALLTWQREAEVAGASACLLSHPAFVPHIEAVSDGTLRVRPDQAEGSWPLGRLVGLLLGEIRRLRDDENGYGPRGKDFFAHVDIPEAVLESFARLIASDQILSLEKSGGYKR